MNNLIEEYRQTLKVVERAKREAHDHIRTVVVVQGEYKGVTGGKKVTCSCGKEVPFLHIYQLDNRTLELCQQCRDKILERAADQLLNKAAAEHDVSQLTSASSDLRYAIEYMTTGFRPGCRRGAHRLSAEQREIPVDPYQFQISTYLIKMAAAGRKRPADLKPEQQEVLNDLLALLTEKQRDAFELVRGRKYSMEEAGQILKIGTSTVKKYVYAAEKKIFFAVGKPREYVQMPPNSEGDFANPVLKKPVKALIQRTMFSDHDKISQRQTGTEANAAAR